MPEAERRHLVTLSPLRGQVFTQPKLFHFLLQALAVYPDRLCGAADIVVIFAQFLQALGCTFKSRQRFVKSRTFDPDLFANFLGCTDIPDSSFFLVLLVNNLNRQLVLKNVSAANSTFNSRRF